MFRIWVCTRSYPPFSFSDQSQGLVLVQGDPVLSWPGPTSHVDGLLNVLNYNASWNIVNNLLVLFNPQSQIVQQLTELNHCLRLKIQSFITRSGEERGIKLFGSTGLAKNVRGTFLYQVSPQDFHQFRTEGFIQVDFAAPSVMSI